MNFVKTTLIGGLLFLVPVVVFVLVVAEAGDMMLAIAEPMSDLFPIDSIAGVAVANIVAIAIVLLICFLAGLLARTRQAQALADKAESAILRKLPGYAMIKGMAGSLSPQQQAEMQPVIVKLDDREVIGLETERIDDGRVAIYFPGSPNAWAGRVEIFEARRVSRIDTPMTAVIEHAELMGKGAGTIASKKN